MHGTQVSATLSLLHTSVSCCMPRCGGWALSHICHIHEAQSRSSQTGNSHALLQQHCQVLCLFPLTLPCSADSVHSLLCGVTVFSTVFSVQVREGQPVNDIVETLKTNGEANTGLTFIWLFPSHLLSLFLSLHFSFSTPPPLTIIVLTLHRMPVLFQHISSGGRVLAIAFFFCLSLAGLSSLISLLELSIHILTDFGGRASCFSLLTNTAGQFADYQPPCWWAWSHSCWAVHLPLT